MRRALLGKPAQTPQRDPASPQFSYHSYPFHLLSLASGRYNAAMERSLKAVGLDQPTWRVLTILAEDGTCSIGTIARAAVYKPSTLSRIVGRMQAAGLVRSTLREGDNRVVEVSLTEAGREAHARTRPISSRVFHTASDALSDEELETLATLLAKLAVRLDA